MWRKPSPLCNSTDFAIDATTPCALLPGCLLAQTLLKVLPGTPQFRASSKAAPLFFSGPPARRPGQLCAVEDGHPIDNDLQSPGTNGVAAFDVEVPDHDIRGHTTTAFSAHLRSCPLQRKSPGSQDTRLRARCSMGGHGSRGDGHIGKCGRRKEWEGGDAGTTTLGTAAGRCESTEMWGMPSRHCWQKAPFCDFQKTILATPSSWQAHAASFCRPCLGSTGLSSSSFCPGRKPATTASHVGTLRTVPLATCSHVPVQHRNLVFRGVEKLTIASATSRCPRFTLGMQSVLLDQCAASALFAAEHKPKPPKFVVTPTALLAFPESPTMPTNWQKHCHSAPSRVSTNFSDNRGLTMRR